MDYRVRLCRAKQGDFDYIEAWLQDPDVRFKMVGKDEETTAVWTSSSERREIYMILRNCDDRTIGYIEVADMNVTGGRAEIKMCIGSGDDRGQGYGPEALELVTTTLKERGFRSIYLRVLTENEPAVRCYEKVGFVKTGILRDHRLGDSDMFLMEYPN